MSARSPRMAFTRRSSAMERPVSVNLFRRTSAADPLFAPMFIALGFCDETLESVKKMRPFRRPGNEDVATVRFIPLAAQIAESAQLVQGTSNNGFRNIKFVRQPPHCVGTRH